MMEDLNKDKDRTFSYSYSAERQREIESIVEKYAPKEEDGMEKLRRLDKSAERPGMIISITSGVIGTLALGLGMCCTLEWTDLFAVGVVVGVIGIALIIAAYPLFVKITKRRREKLAPTILKMSEELKKGM